MASNSADAPADSTSAASKILFCDLCRRFEHISTIHDKKKKAEHFEKYISWYREMAANLKSTHPSVVIDDSFYPTLRLMLPQLDRERGAYGIKELTLAKVYIRLLCLPKEGHDAAKLLNFKAPRTTSGQAGDFADVAFWVLKNRCAEGGSLSVEQVNTHLDNIALKHAAHDPRGVDDELMVMLRAMSAVEQKWLIRILLKDVKLGLGQTRIFAAFHPDARELYDVSNNLVKVCQQLKSPSVRLNEIDVSIFSPFRAMLSERCDISTVETSMKKGQYYYVETKHDGERFQIHMNNGDYKYFSKNGFEYTETYGGTALTGTLTPHIAKQVRGDVKNYILDGEMMVWNLELQCYRAKGVNFDVKSLKPGDRYRPCFCVFDILLLNDQVLSNKPLEERYKYLENLVVSAEGIIELTKSRKVTKKEEIIEELNLAIDNRLEGIMLKDPISVYKPNARKAGWFKIKPEYTEGLMDHIDVLIIGGYYGEGRRKGIISHFLVGVAVPPLDASSRPTKFYSVGKVGSGYTMTELAELLQKVAPFWQRVPVPSGTCPLGIKWTKEKPDVWISPQHSYVLEIKATEIHSTNLFKTGYTFRFPRVEKIRYDKNWFECTTTVQLGQLRMEAEGKLASRRYVSSSSAGSPPKKQRLPGRVGPTLGEQFRSADLSEVTAVSERLEGKEFCVLTGWLEMTKQDVERKIVEHGGTVVQNVRSSTFCALAADENVLRVRNIVKCGEYNVAHMEWMVPVLTRNDVTALPAWTPADLICASPSTREYLSQFYDKYGDSYTKHATQESLSYSLKQVQKKREENKDMLDQKDVADLDIELFSGPSPYGVFRLCFAYFDDARPVTDATTALNVVALDFRFYGGIVHDTITDETTHVILHSEYPERVSELKELNRPREKKFHTTTEKWIIESIKDRCRQQERLFYCTTTS